MTTLLVLTVGQSDVQLVIEGVRHELEPKTCGVLHDEIERRGFRLVDVPAHKDRQRKAELPEGDLMLCTPKLDAVLFEFVPTTALVLETRREARSAPGEPCLSGAALESRLRSRGVTTVHRVAYLTGEERLENRDAPRDSVIRREVVHRLEEAVRSTIELVKPSRIVVATTGGFPVVSNLVEEIVRLHASVDVELLEVADGAKADPPTTDRAVTRTSVPEPLASFQARRRALDLLGRGNLFGAWAVAEPLHSDEIERRWTQTVQWLAHFASSLPIPGDGDILVLKHPRMAVRAALRVELALRAGDIPRAVHGTVTFFEAALWDSIPSHNFEAEGITKINDMEYQLPEKPSQDQRRRFRKRRNEANWRIDDFADGIDAWLQVLNRFALTAFWVALTDDVRNLRNDVAHSEPTWDLMDGARAQMRSAALWSDEDTFLSQPLVRGVLQELEVQRPEALCDDLLRTVRRRLVEWGACS